jgi:hypothetical protein
LRRAVSAILGIASLFTGASRAFGADLPHLAWDQPTYCIKDPAGEVVRVQCEGEGSARVCLVAKDHTADGGELRRSRPCDTTEGDGAYAALVRTGTRFVPATAEVPPGFARSAEGRAYQVKFDLYDRVYLGVAWSPVYATREAGTAPAPGFPFGRAAAEVGFDASVLSPHGRSRHDFEVLEGDVSFADFSVNGLLFAYDYQQVHKRPAFYATTFFGKPRLYGVPIPLGWGFRLLQVEDKPPSLPGSLDAEIGEVHVSLNPVQSKDMYSRLRVEAGADVGKYWTDRTAITQGLSTGRTYLGFTSAVRSRVALGEGGLHYLFTDVAYRRPAFVDGDLAGRSVNRLKASVAYEGIFLAINDQPLSLRLAAIGAARDDPATFARKLEVGMNAGFRVSFWAPARVLEPLPDVEDP